jgi:protein phosphatase
LIFRAFGRTDVGLRRPHNEDSIALTPEIGLFAVADGMGGHAAGEVASHTAVQILSDFVRLSVHDQDFTWPFGFDDKYSRGENLLYTAVQLANRKVCEIAQENPDYLGMGTTLAVVHMRDREAVIAHVGDSRIYRLRDGELDLLTTDHSWVNEQLQRNVLTEEEARNHRWRNVITRALGNRPDIDIDLRTLPVRPGDLFLLCSDGLTTMLDHQQIAQTLIEEGHDPEAACHALINAANQAGGNDNISVILIRVQS